MDDDTPEEILKSIQKEFHEFIVSPDDFKKIRQIGKGGYAEVWLVTNKKTNEQVALKQLYSTLQPKQIFHFAREVKTMANATHPFFVSFLGFSPKSPLSIVSEYIQNGSLFRFMRSESRRARLTGTHRTLIAMGIAHAMDFLHGLGIIHRDLKSLNILLDDKLLPRLCDFGIARFLDGQVMTMRLGTPHWMAPETLCGKTYGPSADVYSFAMLLYELLTNSIPWAGLEATAVMKAVAVDGQRPDLPKGAPKPLIKLIKACWAKKASKRPTFKEIYRLFAKGKVVFADTDPEKVRWLKKKLHKYDKSQREGDKNENNEKVEHEHKHRHSKPEEPKVEAKPNINIDSTNILDSMADLDVADLKVKKSIYDQSDEDASEESDKDVKKKEKKKPKKIKYASESSEKVIKESPKNKHNKDKIRVKSNDSSDSDHNKPKSLDAKKKREVSREVIKRGTASMNGKANSDDSDSESGNMFESSSSISQIASPEERPIKISQQYATNDFEQFDEFSIPPGTGSSKMTSDKSDKSNLRSRIPRPDYNNNNLSPQQGLNRRQSCMPLTPDPVSVQKKKKSDNYSVDPHIKKVHSNEKNPMRTTRSSSGFKVIPVMEQVVTREDKYVIQTNKGEHIDLNIISNQNDPKFKSELKRAVTDLPKRQMEDFFAEIAVHFRMTTNLNTYEFILETCAKIIRDPSAASVFVAEGLHLQLPLDKAPLHNLIFDVLLSIFKFSPALLQDDFEMTMNRLIIISPEKSIILLALFARSFSVLDNAWSLLDLLIKQSPIFLKAKNGDEYITILYFLNTNFEEYRKARLQNCIDVFMEALLVRNPKTINAAYRTLTYYYNEQVDVDFNSITDHLLNDDTYSACLDFLITLDIFQPIESFVYALLQVSLVNLQATLILLQIAETTEGSMIILRNPNWLTSPNPTFNDTFRLLAAILRHKSLRKTVAGLKQLPQFLIDAAKNERIDFVHTVLLSLPPSQDLLSSFRSNNVLKILFEKAAQVTDEKTVHAVLQILMYFGNIDFAPEYLLLAETLKKQLKYQNKNSIVSVRAITLLSKYPLCAQKFVDLRLDSYFKKLKNDETYSNYAHEFLKNISITEYY